jgi:isocitrate/isopropylmalate dehydrogenase
MLSAELLLRWLDGNGHGDGLALAADHLRDGIESALRAGRGTPDLGGEDSTGSYADAVAAAIAG